MGKFFVAVACATVVGGMGTTAAFAGEITGNGQFTPVHSRIAASICSFSGREDATAAGSPLRTQTPHEVWIDADVGVVNPPPGTPGTACQPGGGE